MTHKDVTRPAMLPSEVVLMPAIEDRAAHAASNRQAGGIRTAHARRATRLPLDKEQMSALQFTTMAMDAPLHTQAHDVPQNGWLQGAAMHSMPRVQDYAQQGALQPASAFDMQTPPMPERPTTRGALRGVVASLTQRVPMPVSAPQHVALQSPLES